MVILPNAQDTIKHQSLPPPPPPVSPIYADFIKYMGKHVRYPTAARDKGLVGNVLVSLRIDDKHKITDLKVINGIGSGCDEEVIRALKSYPGTISQKPGTYRIITSFALEGNAGSKSHYPDQIADNIAVSKNFIGQVVVVGYASKLSNKLPPPPPAPPAKEPGKVKFPPPPAPPAKGLGKVKFPPPAPPQPSSKALKAQPAPPKIEVIHFPPPSGKYDTSAGAKKAKARKAVKVKMIRFPQPIVQYMPFKKGSKAKPNDTSTVDVIHSLPLGMLPDVAGSNTQLVK